MPALAINSWILNVFHTVLTFVFSLGSYWSSLASKFQFQNATKGFDWLPAGYYTHPVADAMYFAGMKTPLHLGILVLEDTYCLAAISLAISLAYSIGTRHFSVYAKGLSQAEYQILEDKINHLLQRDGRETNVQVRHILSSDTCGTPGLQDHEKSKANVHIVNPGDGQQMLFDVTKHLAELIKHGKVSQKDITPDYIDKLLQNRLKCPDPDMILKFGTVPSTGGYLPWQMRLSEILFMGSLRSFTPQSMKRALLAFSKIGQRFGK